MSIRQQIASTEAQIQILTFRLDGEPDPVERAKLERTLQKTTETLASLQFILTLNDTPTDRKEPPPPKNEVPDKRPDSMRLQELEVRVMELEHKLKNLRLEFQQAILSGSDGPARKKEE